MIPITFNDAPAYLIDDAPDWTSGIQLDAASNGDVKTGLTGREDRRGFGDTLRIALKYSTTIQGSALPVFRNALQALNVQPVLCPLWLFYFDAGATPLVTTAFYILMGDGSDPEIKADTDRPFTRPAYPLLVGRFDELPNPALLSDETATANISFIEDDSNAVTFSAYVPPDGLDAANGTRPLFPWRPDWSSSPNSGRSEVDVDRRQIGEGRAMSSAYYEQRSRRTSTQSFTLQTADCLNLLRFFVDMGGMVQNFWLPASLSEARLTANVASGDTSLSVDNVNALSGNAFICLDDLNNRVPLEVTGIAGSAWTLAAVCGTDFDSSYTRIESMFLARFNDNKLSLKWDSPQFATVQIPFYEVPWEVDDIDDGDGPLATTAYLYVFTINYPGITQTYAFTGFERNLSDGTTNYTRAPMQHGDITETATIERQSVDITTRNFVGNPAALMMPNALEFPMNLDIYEVDVDGGTASNLRRIFSGEVRNANPEGPYWKLTALSMSHVLDNDNPNVLIQPTCNLMVYSARCGMDSADFNWQGLVTSVDAGKITLTLNTVHRVTGSAVTLDPHFFAGGFVVVGVGAATQYRMIADSAAVIGSTIVLSLASPLVGVPAVGDTVNFFPGCDGRKETCIARFDNYENFLGFPFMPVGNPSILPVVNPSAGGKK